MECKHLHAVKTNYVHSSLVLVNNLHVVNYFHIKLSARNRLSQNTYFQVTLLSKRALYMHEHYHVLSPVSRKRVFGVSTRKDTDEPALYNRH